MQVHYFHGIGLRAKQLRSGSATPMWFLQSLPLDREVIHLVATVIVLKSRPNRKQLLQTGDVISVRLLFAFLEVKTHNRDFSTSDANSLTPKKRYKESPEI
jgi:hypothetical protein